MEKGIWSYSLENSICLLKDGKMPQQYLYVQQPNFLIRKMNFMVEAVPARLVLRVCDALANEKVLFGTICSNRCHYYWYFLQQSYCRKYQSVLYQLKNLNVGYHILGKNEKQTLERGEWLTDRHVTAAQMLLKKRFPNING